MGIWVFPTVLSHKGYWVDNEQEDLCADEGRCSKTTHARKADTHGKQTHTESRPSMELAMLTYSLKD